VHEGASGRRARRARRCGPLSDGGRAGACRAGDRGIRDRTAAGGSARLMKAIVVGTDGSDTAARAVREAGDLAKSTGAKLHIVSAYVPAAGIHASGSGLARENWMVGPDVQVDSVLAQAAGAMHAQGIEAESHARKGDPADALLNVADEQDAD